MKFFNFLFGYEEEKNNMNNSDKISEDIKNAQNQINDMTEEIDKIAKNLGGNKKDSQKSKNQKKKK